ncbi:cell division protein ZapE [Nitratireductor mangrovi]|uniref:Cell division protein ZapE n=1 Tax=Nitratireductor mangrovi TaxID=2599600 RepID=A0A5B8L1Z8_9HYPH|nr:cell division protein ZapE [Nitratireductor mangrovi]QDZ01692.1 cell division protein ZapE [Nitratireductor mangrovi]
MSLRDGLQPFPSVRQAYERLIERGEVTRDLAQEKIAKRLDRLVEELANKRLAAKSSALGWLFARRREPKAPVKGLYIHGAVGRGKTMLMDLFFELVPVNRKRRVHFNDFMAEVHDRIGRHRTALKAGEVKGDDPIPPVARALAGEAWVLCFDEFSVTDIADAMILSRLFSALFEEGVVLVATSNVAPQKLYHNGLNRPLFEPFIAILARHADVMSLDSDTDYRLEKLNRLPVYLTPLDEETGEAFEAAWRDYANGAAEQAEEVAVKGRSIKVPRATRDAARFTFEELCGRPLGARDYLAIAARFQTLFVESVPVFDDAMRNEAKRFILLIDTLYDKRMRLIASAAAQPQALYRGRTGTTESFEFERTASRLIEMQSRDWPDGKAEEAGVREAGHDA